MNIPTKKLKSGFELPVYGLGIWQMGGRWEADTSKDAEEIGAIRAALDAGITHIDTAESYGNGHAEELLREALKGYDRSKLVITTKISADNQSYEGVHESFNASLERMGLDYVDLYLLHRFPAPGIDIADTMRAMDELVEQGLVKNIGVCNMTPHRFDVIQKLTKNKLVCNQVHFNVQYREIEDKGVLKHSQENDVMLVAWRPLQKGILPETALLKELAAKYNKTPSQIAINWLISQDNVVTLSKTSNVEHLRENLGALGWTMDKSDVERIRSKFPDQQMVSDAVPLDYEADVST
ncbi:MAG TPA: aldo/keto reductase [Candidatus Saccharimonadales bacterium]